ncbi:hypothetical protein EGW08_001030 [Elysia chlorotica]|uniref:Uncharacterized protein n=1 Tax=Elysia chlorotica TaxID=188477 RepID=A0A3S1A163_ELYCH|nr:hypothetical protein EGW08_001030 [Elysia chlorotica]
MKQCRLRQLGAFSPDMQISSGSELRYMTKTGNFCGRSVPQYETFDAWTNFSYRRLDLYECVCVCVSVIVCVCSSKKPISEQNDGKFNEGAGYSYPTYGENFRGSDKTFFTVAWHLPQVFLRNSFVTADNPGKQTQRSSPLAETTKLLAAAYATSECDLETRRSLSSKVNRTYFAAAARGSVENVFNTEPGLEVNQRSEPPEAGVKGQVNAEIPTHLIG